MNEFSRSADVGSKSDKRDGETCGWRREIREVATDNFIKFQTIAGHLPKKIKTVSISDNIRMSLLLARIPLLRDRQPQSEEKEEVFSQHSEDLQYDDAYSDKKDAPWSMKKETAMRNLM